MLKNYDKAWDVNEKTVFSFISALQNKVRLQKTKLREAAVDCDDQINQTSG